MRTGLAKQVRGQIEPDTLEASLRQLEARGLAESRRGPDGTQWRLTPRGLEELAGLLAPLEPGGSPRR